MAKKLLILFFIAGALSMLVMSLHYFQFEISGLLQGKPVAEQSWYRLVFKTHVLLGIVAITVGPFQFIQHIRLRFRPVHKALGYIYFASVVVSSISGLLVAQFAMGGWVTALGFSVLSVAWLFVTVAAVVAARAGALQKHKKWMYISYGLTFAAIPQRTLLLVPLLTDAPFMLIYQFSSWLPWMLNFLIAYLLYHRSMHRTQALRV
ncbi:MAG: DUF2306 domain-containing protein [Gammaproteobacteria bacterium]|nr:DUF2306 domain-containing protein [Gammaproteobacteria bacterium]